MPLANISRFLGGVKAAFPVAVLVVCFNDRPYHGFLKVGKDQNT